MSKKVYVLDASAFINLKTPFESGLYVTTPEVVDEVQDFYSHLYLDLALSQGLVKVMSPSPENLEKVKNACRKVRVELSPADISIAALASELMSKGYDVTVLTDDYSLMNVLKLMGIKFKPLTKTGITNVVRWIYYCEGCGRVFKHQINECPFCGSKVKKKYKKLQ